MVKKYWPRFAQLVNDGANAGVRFLTAEPVIFWGTLMALPWPCRAGRPGRARQRRRPMGTGA